MHCSGDSTSPGFWTGRYTSGAIPWDLGGPPPALEAFLNRSAPSAGRRVLIPGCGSGYEVQVFHQAGFDVTAVDFSPAAVDRARAVLGPLGEKVVTGDFFTGDFGVHDFDLVYERASLCLFPPERRPEYIRRMRELLKPGGVLAGVFLYGVQPEPPPHPLTDGQAAELFSRDFRLVRSEPLTGSVPLFEGLERWQEWECVPAAAE